MEREVLSHHLEPVQQIEPRPARLDRQQALLERLEAAVGAIQDADSFRRYLDAQARFHRYSWSNVALILSQDPEATRVAGYRTWQAVNRQVRRGETGIRIIVPLPTTPRRDQPEGREGPQDDMQLQRPRFGVGTVFDIRQTDGEPLPQVEVPLLETDDGGMLYDDLARLAHTDGIRVDRAADPSPTGAMGVYYPASRRIVVREATQLQMTKTLAHELAHHFTGMLETYDARRDEHETIAESVAYVVLAHFGLDSGARSFPYIATWAQHPGTLRDVLGTIQHVAATLISQVEHEAGMSASATHLEGLA